MQRTYLALATLLAGASVTVLQGLPLQANPAPASSNTVPSRAPLGQGQPTGAELAQAPDPLLVARLAAAGLDIAEASLLLPPPPPQTQPQESGTIVSLEVVPYRP